MLDTLKEMVGSLGELIVKALQRVIEWLSSLSALAGQTMLDAIAGGSEWLGRDAELDVAWAKGAYGFVNAWFPLEFAFNALAAFVGWLVGYILFRLVMKMAPFVD